MEKTALSGVPVLVTGGASFIGSHLSEALVAQGAEVSVIDDLSSGRLEHLSAIASQIEFKQGDARDPNTMLEACRGKKILFHLAAAHGGRGYIDTHPVECLNNLVVDHNVFVQAARTGVERVVFASSACVYPTTLQSSAIERELLTEDAANFDRPGGAYADGEYGWAKLMGEYQLRAVTKQFPVSGTACRIFTAYGERENESHAVVALIAKALLRIDPFPVWGNGLQTRNFTYVGDTVEGLMLGAALPGKFETLNVGQARHFTILELLEEIFEAVGWRPGDLSFELDRPVGVLSRASDNRKIQEHFNWEPATSLKEGVRRTVSWYREISTNSNRLELERKLTRR